jgi:hypothetical protein
MRSRGRPPKYDWTVLFDGAEHFCFPERDFTCKPSSFRALVYRMAGAKGYAIPSGVHLDKHNGSVRFRAVPLDR